MASWCACRKRLVGSATPTLENFSVVMLTKVSVMPATDDGVLVVFFFFLSTTDHKIVGLVTV